MSIKAILISVIVGSAALISVRAFNLAFYTPLSFQTLIEIAAGPFLAFALVRKEFRVRILVAIGAFAGLIGLTLLGIDVVRYMFSDGELSAGLPRYLAHGGSSLFLLAIYGSWLAGDRRREKMAEEVRG